ncbi:hypothetical protein WQ54_16445 [Bacillus sp. SA1-12]|uniref:hypothetical protein n=1 Tax=Bacillus sp. SA1-12 TaxID=1455638 RepID=UPI0006271D15|nr:hypothetical protein [Bacillus sp. SA1-12]KKI91160.1 hypothetical protein WQ54_16445 [Bacillus sp. SA1-12]
MKNLLYALISLVMLFLGLQQITMTGDHMQTVFLMSWLCLAIFVIGGNFAHYLYKPKKAEYNQQSVIDRNRQRKRQRQTAR